MHCNYCNNIIKEKDPNVLLIRNGYFHNEPAIIHKGNFERSVDLDDSDYCSLKCFISYIEKELKLNNNN